MDTLKPCPFCGVTGSYGMYEGRHYVCCVAGECLTQPKTYDFYTKELAFEAWNKRTSEWVSVKTDLPESGQDVLFYDGSVKKGWFDDFNNIDKTKGRFFWELGSANNSVDQSKITHWQPISSPKGDE